MSKIIENVTKAIQSIELVRDDLKAAYGQATALECVALDAAMFAVCDAWSKLDPLLDASEAKE